MKDKKYWLGITVSVMKEKEYFYSYMLEVSESDNICSKIRQHKDIKWINIFSTKKKAREVVVYWNESFKKNGTLYLDL